MIKPTYYYKKYIPIIHKESALAAKICQLGGDSLSSTEINILLKDKYDEQVRNDIHKDWLTKKVIKTKHSFGDLTDFKLDIRLPNEDFKVGSRELVIQTKDGEVRYSSLFRVDEKLRGSEVHKKVNKYYYKYVYKLILRISVKDCF